MLRGMTIRFTARVVGVAEDQELECLSAGVAENDDGDGMELIFMCGLLEPEPGGEDGYGENGDEEDSYCLVREGQETAYGAVREIALRDRVLRVVIAPHALAELRLDDPEFEVLLDVEDEEIDQLRPALRRILSYGRPDAHPAVVHL